MFLVITETGTVMFVVRQSVADRSLQDPLCRCQARSVSDHHLPVAAEGVIDVILRLADVPHSVISTGSSESNVDQQQQRLQPAQTRLERRRAPRGPSSSPRRQSGGGSNHSRIGLVRPLSSDSHAHLRTATVRSATPSPLGGRPSLLGFGARRNALTLDRLERTASDFDVRLLAEKSMTLPKSDGHHGRSFPCFPREKYGGASDGDDIDETPGRLAGKRRTHFRFKNLFRSTDKSLDMTKLFSRKTSTRKMWENCL